MPISTPPANLNIIENHHLAPLTGFKVGGPARFFVSIADTATSPPRQLLAALDWAASNNLPIKILGQGTNILVPDTGYPGLVIHLQPDPSTPIEKILSPDSRPAYHTPAGLPLAALVTDFAQDGLDLSWAAGIPGTVGGAIRGNAGAFDGDCASDLVSVKYLDLDHPDQPPVTLPAADCQFSYRQSIFKTHPRYLILSGTWCPPTRPAAEIQTAITDHLAYRRTHHPIDLPSAGSTFKNPSPEQSAGWLIEQVGLKGHIVGHAQISPKHSNFIVNLGGATAQDIYDLIRVAQTRVHEQFGLTLEPEIDLWA